MYNQTEKVHEQGFTDLVLVCTNDCNSEKACCAEAYGGEVYNKVKRWLHEREVFWSHVYVSETSCLGLCSSDGTAIAIQPRNRWFSDVTPDEVPDLLENEFGSSASDLGQKSSSIK
jgi:predicted metal-binding protein